ncbi:MAG: hypothetical protein JJU45_00435 [Acidimicrobiia bacterium]|nr:hypothetical protein [Acidimicrobiia bacterium]
MPSRRFLAFIAAVTLVMAGCGDGAARTATEGGEPAVSTSVVADLGGGTATDAEASGAVRSDALGDPDGGRSTPERQGGREIDVAQRSVNPGALHSDEGHAFDSAGLLDHLRRYHGDRSWVTYFDWQDGDGAMGIDRSAVTTVLLVAAGELASADALEACETVWGVVAELDAPATIEVRHGGLAGELAARRGATDQACSVELAD